MFALSGYMEEERNKIPLPNNAKKNTFAFKNSLSEYCIISSLKILTHIPQG